MKSMSEKKTDLGDSGHLFLPHSTVSSYLLTTTANDVTASDIWALLSVSLNFDQVEKRAIKVPQWFMPRSLAMIVPRKIVATLPDSDVFEHERTLAVTMNW